jgi:glycosyltransferase involved in cell wall biosynthesis
MISVIIPAYNSRKTINITLESLLQQTVLAYEQMEIIIVNDGSTDETNKIVNSFMQEFKSNNINFVYIEQENKGAPAARNRGFKESAGEYLLFCDADIILKPNMLAKMRRALEDFPDAGFAYSSFKWGWKTFGLWPFDAEKLKQMPYINTNSLIKRRAMPEDGWDENLKRFQDWDLFLRIVKNGYTGVWLPEILFKIIPAGIISSWLPKITYKLPWRSRNVKEYSQAMQKIKQKHNIL